MRTAGRTEIRVGRALSIFLPILGVLALIAIGWMALLQQRPSELAAPSAVLPAKAA